MTVRITRTRRAERQASSEVLASPQATPKQKSVSFYGGGIEEAGLAGTLPISLEARAPARGSAAG